MKRLIVLIAFALIVAVPASQASVPSTINGLRTKLERSEATKQQRKRQYLTNVDLYSLRRGKTLEATLQFGTFREDAPVGSRKFQRSIAGQLGSTIPIEQRVGGLTLYLAKAKSLTLVAWFRGRTLAILSIRANYTTPKTLIRNALDVQP